jgi:hypothetical protein
MEVVMIKVNEDTIFDPASGIEYRFLADVEGEAVLEIDSIHAPVDKGHPWTYHGESAEAIWMALHEYQTLKGAVVKE